MNLARVFFIAALSVLLIGCEQAATYDQCLRREIFQQCMAALPAGPQSTKYNDWDEVVSQCDTAAGHQSIRQRRFIKPECMP